MERIYRCSYRPAGTWAHICGRAWVGRQLGFSPAAIENASTYIVGLAAITLMTLFFLNYFSDGDESQKK